MYKLEIKSKFIHALDTICAINADEKGNVHSIN